MSKKKSKDTINKVHMSKDGSVRLLKQVAPTEGEMNAFSAELNLSKAQRPENSFSAQTVIINFSELGYVEIYFVCLSASKSKATSYVCVRIQPKELQRFISVSQVFTEQLENFVEKANVSTRGYSPLLLENLDNVQPERTLYVEGTAIYMAHQEMMAICDIYEFDAFVRSLDLKNIPDLKPIIRINLPTIILSEMLTKLKEEETIGEKS